MNILKRIFKKLYTLVSYSLSKNISIDFRSEINPFKIKFKNIKSDQKILIMNSVISGDVSIGGGSKIVDSFVNGNVELERFVSINGPATRLSSRINGIKIGSFSSIASNVVIQEDYHRTDKISTYFMSKNLFKSSVAEDIDSKGKIIIEEDVWIGSNSVVLSGVTIGRGSVIGAGSVVTKSIPKYSIAVGNPCRVIKKRFNEEVIESIEKSQWWDMDTKDFNKFKSVFTYSSNDEEIIKLINSLKVGEKNK